MTCIMVWSIEFKSVPYHSFNCTLLNPSKEIGAEKREDTILNEN